jgi:Uracil DNA glycosylase superfamily
MFSGKVIKFLKELEFNGPLPEGISIMNPFRDNPGIIPVITQFYNKYYSDNNPRYLILGINPGRFGAGVTGIPFTDTRRLFEKCGFSMPGIETYETSSSYIYEMIDAFGGVEKFYNKFFISAVCPLGFTTTGSKGKSINYNYYDSKMLTDAVMELIVGSLYKQLEFGIEKDYCFCLGTGKNFTFLKELNNKLRFFGQIVPLEHPRYIMQYKSKQKQIYINRYIEVLGKV